MTTKENQVEKSIGQWLQVYKFFFWKTTSNGFFDTKTKRFRKHVSPFVKNGAPDFIVVHQGYFIGIEVKSPVGRMSESQKEFMHDLRKAGGIYILARSIDDVEKEFQSRGFI